MTEATRQALIAEAKRLERDVQCMNWAEDADLVEEACSRAQELRTMAAA